MGRKVSEVVAEIQEIEASGGDATAMREKLTSLGHGSRLPPPPAPPAPPPPSFMQQWGRPIAEAGGSLLGGALGAPGNIPGIMAGAALGGHVAGAGMDMLQGNPAPPPAQQVLSAGLNSMGGPAPTGFRSGAALANGPNLQPSAQDAARAVSARGGTTTPGQRGSGFMARIEGALESSPFAGPTMDRNRKQTMGIFGDIVEEASPTATSREAAGEAAIEGYEYNKARAGAYVEDAYRLFDEAVEKGGGRGAKIPASSLQDLSSQYKTLLATDGGFADLVYQDTDLSRSIAAIDDMVARGDSPSYDVLKRLRTMIGKKIDFNSPGSEQIGLKSLYDTLTEDLAEGALELGGEVAQKAGQNADSMFRSMQVQLKALDPVFKYADTPAKLNDALNRALLHNPKLADSARRAMGQNAWDQYRDTWLRMNTLATPRGQNLAGNAVSPHTTFSALSNLKKTSPEGYALLTEGREEGIAVIERLAEMGKEGEAYINRSRSGGAVGANMFGGDIIGATIGAGMGMAAGQTIPAVAAGIGLIARPILSKLTAAAITSKRLNDALIKVGKQYDQLPVGRDLARALIVAGADSHEIERIFSEGETYTNDLGEDTPPAYEPPSQLYGE